MMRILIIKLGAIGDVLRTTCILPGLRKKYKNCVIEWLTDRDALDILSSNPSVGVVHVTEQLTLEKLVLEKFDLVVNLDDSELACMIATEVTTEKIVGCYYENGAYCYTDDSAPWFDLSLISRFGKAQADKFKKQNLITYPDILFRMLEIPEGRPTLRLGDKELTYARDFLNRNSLEGQNIVGLNTGAGQRWRYKRLSERKTADLADLLTTEVGAAILLFGGPQEAHRNKRIIEMTKETIWDAGCDNSLLQFAALVNSCKVLVTSDSLGLHVGTSLNVDLVAFFGPTSAAEIKMSGNGTKVIPNLDCLCCYKHDCDFVPNCMESIDIGGISNTVKTIMRYH